MCLNQTPTGFNLGEKLDYKQALREYERDALGISTHTFRSPSLSYAALARQECAQLFRVEIFNMISH